jgi:biopolymer transport protein ExbD
MPLKLSNDEMPTLNLTAMIDVLFLLIIFFVVGTRFVEEERSIEIKVPQVTGGGALSDAPAKKLVNVYQDGQITLDGKVVTMEELTERLAFARRQYKGLGVTVRGDGSGKFQTIASVLNACKQAGVSELSISVLLAGTDQGHARR